jgi:hypothetical protein
MLLPGGVVVEVRLPDARPTAAASCGHFDGVLGSEDEDLSSAERNASEIKKYIYINCKVGKALTEVNF